MGKKRRNKKDDVSVVSILVGLGATYFVAMGTIDLNTALRNAVCGMYDSYLAVNEGAEYIDEVASYCDMTKQEAEMLNELMQ